MSSFKGFSEDDIKKLSSHTGNNRIARPIINEEIINSKRVILQVGKNQKQAVIKNLSKFKQNSEAPADSVNIPEEAKLSSTSELISINKNDKLHGLISETNHVQNGMVHPQKNQKNNDAVHNLNDNYTKEEKFPSVIQNEFCSENINEADNLSLEAKRNSNLQTLQVRHKLIEEQNRKRKEILAKVLADKAKKTREETEKLNEVQKEFKKLDALLSDDVNILRKKIEMASLEFMEAEKRYNKAEKEFLAAKFTLHQKQERKELLTEHLCAIIEKNEERKAEKLNELLDKLNAGSDQFPTKNVTLNGNTN